MQREERDNLAYRIRKELEKSDVPSSIGWCTAASLEKGDLAIQIAKAIEESSLARNIARELFTLQENQKINEERTQRYEREEKQESRRDIIAMVLVIVFWLSVVLYFHG